MPSSDAKDIVLTTQAQRASQRLSAPRDMERIVLGNGVRVWTEHIPGSSSAAIGVWFDWASPYEQTSHSGGIHLIQRLALHGAGSQNGEDITRTVEPGGGKASIITGRDHFGYVAEASPKRFLAALGLVADLALCPIPTRSSIAVEQKEVMDQVLSEDADPNAAVEALFLRSAWIGLGHCREPKGRLLRIRDSMRLQSFTPSALRRLHRESHRPSAITVTISGSVEHGKVQRSAERIFGALKEPPTAAAKVSAASRRFWATCNRPEFGDVRIMIGAPVCGAADEDRHVAALLAAVLGGGAESRLARLLGVDKRSAEGGVSKVILFAHDGVLATRLTTEPASAQTTLTSVVEAMRRLATDSVSTRELKNAREICSSALHPAFLSIVERIEDMARQERYFSAVVDPHQEEVRMRAVTPSNIREFASSRIAPHTLSVAAVGNLDGVGMDPAALRW